MKYSVDRIEANIAIVEDIITKEIKEIPLNKILGKVRDGSIIVFSNGNYILDENEEEKIRLRIEEKLSKLEKRNSSN